MGGFPKRRIVRPIPIFREMDRLIKCILKKEWHIEDEQFYFLNVNGNYEQIAPYLTMWVNAWKAIQAKIIGDVKLIDVESFTAASYMLSEFNAVTHERIVSVINSYDSLKNYYAKLDFNEREEVDSILKMEQIRMYFTIAIK